MNADDREFARIVADEFEMDFSDYDPDAPHDDTVDRDDGPELIDADAGEVTLPADWDTWTDANQVSWAWPDPDDHVPRSIIRDRQRLWAEWEAAQIRSGNEGASATEPPVPMFVDWAALDDDSNAVTATVGVRTDGMALFYRSAVNSLIGDPEQGKTFIAAATEVEILRDGGTVVHLDLDHNGAKPYRERVRALGGGDYLERLMFAEADNREGVMSVVAWAIANAVDLFVVDSLGELLPMFGANSDSSDDYTRVHREVLSSVSRTGPCVIVVDHLAKGSESRGFGASGTIAKKRAIDGAIYRVTAIKQFAPGLGGSASLRLLKDRHGSVRGALASTSKEPEAAVFDMQPDGSWAFTDGKISTVDPIDALVAMVALMDPLPKSQHAIRDALGIGAAKAKEVWDRWQS